MPRRGRAAVRDHRNIYVDGRRNGTRDDTSLYRSKRIFGKARLTARLLQVALPLKQRVLVLFRRELQAADVCTPRVSSPRQDINRGSRLRCQCRAARVTHRPGKRFIRITCRADRESTGGTAPPEMVPAGRWTQGLMRQVPSTCRIEIRARLSLRARRRASSCSLRHGCRCCNSGRGGCIVVLLPSMPRPPIAACRRRRYQHGAYIQR